jgi:hypothetical protein
MEVKNMENVYPIIIILSILADLLLGAIPATIANRKGYDTAIFYVYGIFLFPLSLIHLALLPNKYEQMEKEKMYRNIEKIVYNTNTAMLDSVEVYKALMKKGIISLEDFESIRKQIYSHYFTENNQSNNKIHD